jgi:hypothetical protein
LEVSVSTATEFARIIIQRGMGLYGTQKMLEICKKSGLSCRNDGTFEPLDEKKLEKKLEKLIINYAQFNLPAKMTALVLAKKHNIPIPEELKGKKRRKSKYQQKLIAKT